MRAPFRFSRQNASLLTPKTGPQLAAEMASEQTFRTTLGTVLGTVPTVVPEVSFETRPAGTNRSSCCYLG
jgi:hypothetical protein